MKRRKLGIIVPYRNRQYHLCEFLKHMKTFLNGRVNNYKIYIVEQNDEKLFNRGKLLNIGFTLIHEDIDYICTHDIDLLPETADYRYVQNPTHLCHYLDRRQYKKPPPHAFGGVNLFRKEHFALINGYSNEYWGWGAEDDDLRLRCKREGLQILSRPGRYKSLPHDRQHVQEYNDYIHANRKRLNDFRLSKISHKEEGLNSLNYSLIERIEKQDIVILKVII